MATISGKEVGREGCLLKIVLYIRVWKETLFIKKQRHLSVQFKMSELVYVGQMMLL